MQEVQSTKLYFNKAAPLKRQYEMDVAGQILLKLAGVKWLLYTVAMFLFAY